MSEELAIQLERLYRDYYARRLAFDDYRYRRGLLLDSLAESAAPAPGDDATLPRTARTERPGTVDVETPPAAAPKKPTVFRWYYVLAACVIVVIAVVFFVNRQFGVPGTGQPAVAGSPPDAPPAEPLDAAPDVAPADEVQAPAGPVQRLVDDFVARQDWREMSLLEFEDAWARLPESDRIVAKGAVWFEPLEKIVAYRIDEIREFSADPDDDPALDQLYEFALHLGLVQLVPPGWMPDPNDINRGAASLDANETADSGRLPETPPPAAGTEATAVTPAAEADEAEAPDASGADASVPEATAAGDGASPMPATASPDNPNACSAAQLQTRRRNCFDLLADGGRGPAMRVIPGGTFVTGGGGAPGRTVAIEKPFAISLHEISVDDYRAYCVGENLPCPEDPWADGEMPVVNVSWRDATAYAAWLSRETGYTYRLPSDAEWEYAARAGTSTDYPYGDKLLPAQARYSSITAYDSPLPAGDNTTQRNEFGLWHMIGNVQEWVDAEWNGDPGTRVVRGGSFASSEDELRVSARSPLPIDARNPRTGLRLVREL